MRKIIFLDIDGVLNSSNFFERQYERGLREHQLDQHAVLRLKMILHKTNAEVVLSSSWRGHEDNHKIIREQVTDFIDITPHSKTGIRGVEIHQWLDANIEPSVYQNYSDIENHRIAIIDDDSDMLLWQKDCFFKCDNKTGLTLDIIERVIKHLNFRVSETT